jgi:hypothetical protein
MKPLTEYARATPERQAEMLREWARQARERYREWER